MGSVALNFFQPNAQMYLDVNLSCRRLRQFHRVHPGRTRRPAALLATIDYLWKVKCRSATTVATNVYFTLTIHLNADLYHVFGGMRGTGVKLLVFECSSEKEMRRGEMGEHGPQRRGSMWSRKTQIPTKERKGAEKRPCFPKMPILKTGLRRREPLIETRGNVWAEPLKMTHLENRMPKAACKARSCIIVTCIHKTPP